MTNPHPTTFLPHPPPPVVQFSKLDENNKAEFLQFLIKNNITFDNASGRDNVIAKVTLKNVNTVGKISNVKTSNNGKLVSGNKEVKKRVGGRGDNKENAQIVYQNGSSNSSKNITTTTTITNKPTQSPLKQKTFNNNQPKTHQATLSPFSKVKLTQKPLPQSTLTITPKPSTKLHQTNSNLSTHNNQQSTRTKSPYRQTKLYGPLSPGKNNAGNERLNMTESKSIRKENILLNASPIKTDRVSPNAQKQSRERLSNLKRLPDSSSFTKIAQNRQFQKDPTTSTTRKVLNKSPINHQPPSCSNNLSSREFLPRGEKDKTLSVSYSNQQQSFNTNNGYGIPNNTNKTQQQGPELQQRIHLVNRYIAYFSDFMGNTNNNPNTPTSNKKLPLQVTQRPICWPLAQVQKFLDEFYDENFAKNTTQILNGSKRLNQSLAHRKHERSSHIVQALERFFNRKFNKVQKAIEYHLVNLLYSVAVFVGEGEEQGEKGKLQKEEESRTGSGSLVFLRMFEAFLTEQHSLEEYLFFLFSRNILKQDFKKSFISLPLPSTPSTRPSSSFPSLSSPCTTINKKEIDRFLKHIIGQNNQPILQQYHRMIFQKVPGYEIEVNRFMRILVEDYKGKRQAAEESQRGRNKEVMDDEDGYQEDYMEEDSSLENTFNRILGLGGQCPNSISSSSNNNHNNNNHNNNRYPTLFPHTSHHHPLIPQQQQATNSIDELTFGQQTKQFLLLQQQQADLHHLQNPTNIPPSSDYSFWQSPYINKKNENSEKERFMKDDFVLMVVEKLCQKTGELIGILGVGVGRKEDRKEGRKEGRKMDRKRGSRKMDNREEDWQQQQSHQSAYQDDDHQQQQHHHHHPSSQNNSPSHSYPTAHLLQQLLFSKALCLFFTVLQMNKVKWLKQLHITHPTQEDIEKVQEIQLFFRKIRELPTAKDIAEFCKLILTVRQITEGLSGWFVGGGVEGGERGGEE